MTKATGEADFALEASAPRSVSDCAVTACRLSEILYQHRVYCFCAPGEDQTAIARPVEIENLAGREMRHRPWRTARRPLFPDVAHAVHAVEERDGAPIRGPQ